MALDTTPSAASSVSTTKSIGTSSIASSFRSATSHAASISSTRATSSLLSTSIATTLSTKTSTPTISSSGIAWGPAITATSLPPISTEAVSPTAKAVSSQSPGPLNFNSGSSGFSEQSRDILIVTTVIGGTFIIALLIYAIYKRRRGATYAQILHVKPRAPSTIVMTPTPMRSKFKSLPIVRDLRYSVHSSKHDSVAGSYRGGMQQKAVPREVADRFHKQNTYIQNTWKTDLGPSRRASPPPPIVPEKDPGNRLTFLFDASPTVDSAGVKAPEKARVSVSVRPVSTVSRPTRLSIMSTNSPDDSLGTVFRTPPGSPQSHKLLAHDAERWSWTNSQAPPTPRLFGNRASQDTSSASSRKSMPRFRSVVSWVRGQSERIDEEAPALPAPPLPPPKTGRPVLKNQAVKPVLAPVKLTNERRPSLAHTQKSSLSSIFKTNSRARNPSKASEDVTALPSTIEMTERPST